MNPLCIYHANCADGFTAAWVVRRHFGPGNVDFHPGVYQDPPPDVAGRDVYLVDFSYKKPVLVEMWERARSITVLDHHKTAEADLGQLYGDGMTVVFDLNRSGARIAWDHFFPREEAPKMVLYVEDRDLWRFKMHASREVSANLLSHAFDFATWDHLMKIDGHGLFDFVEQGKAIERQHHKDIAELLPVVTRMMRIGSGGGVIHEVPVANLPYVYSSDAGHALAKGDPSKIGICYWDTPDGRVFSLRSTDDGPDVSAIAKHWGGGGHARAAGFRVSYDTARTFELEEYR